MRTKTALFFLAAFLLLASCATQPTIAPGPLGEAQSKLTEARSLTKPTETRITDYFEAAEIAEQEAESQSADAAIKQQARQACNNAGTEVTVLLEEADGGKYWNQNGRIGAYNVRFQPSTSNGLWSPGFYMPSWVYGTNTINAGDTQDWWLWWPGYPGFEVIGVQVVTQGSELRTDTPGVQQNSDGSTTYFISVFNPESNDVEFHFRGSAL